MKSVKNKKSLVSLSIIFTSVIIYFIMGIISAPVFNSYASNRMPATSSDAGSLAFSSRDELAERVRQRINLTVRLRYDNIVDAERPEIEIYLKRNNVRDSADIVLDNANREYTWRSLAKFEFIGIFEVGGRFVNRYRQNSWTVNVTPVTGYIIETNDMRSGTGETGEIVISVRKDNIPATPSEPVSPTEPATPSVPVNPAEPIIPGEPNTPISPGNDISLPNKDSSSGGSIKESSKKGLKINIKLINEEDLNKENVVLNYEIEVRNTSDEEINGVWVRDYMPKYTHYKSGDGIGKYGYINSKEHMTWFIDKLDAKSKTVLKFSAKLDSCRGEDIKSELFYEITGTTEAPYFNTDKNPKNKL